MYLILLSVIIILGGASYLISSPIYKRLKREGNKFAFAWSAFVFLTSFVLIGLGLFLAINLTFHR